MIGCGAILLLFFAFFGIGSLSTVVTVRPPAPNLEIYADLPQFRTEDGGFVLGEPEAPITLAVFSDWSCPSCQAYQQTVDAFIDRYVRTGQAKFEARVIRTSGEEITRYASQLAECAEEQRPGAYWQAFVLLYDYGLQGFETYNESMARPFSETLNLDVESLLTCTPTSQQFERDAELAQVSGVNATPTIFFRLNDGELQPLPGGREIEDLARLVEQYTAD